MASNQAENRVLSAVTAADTQRYREFIKQGDIDAVYQDLQAKGFDSAHWAMAEFKK